MRWAQSFSAPVTTSRSARGGGIPFAGTTRATGSVSAPRRTAGCAASRRRPSAKSSAKIQGAAERGPCGPARRVTAHSGSRQPAPGVARRVRWELSPCSSQDSSSSQSSGFESTSGSLPLPWQCISRRDDRSRSNPSSGHGESRTSDGTHQRPSWRGEVAGPRGRGLEGKPQLLRDGSSSGGTESDGHHAARAHSAGR